MPRIVLLLLEIVCPDEIVFTKYNVNVLHAI